MKDRDRWGVQGPEVGCWFESIETNGSEEGISIYDSKTKNVYTTNFENQGPEVR